MRALPTLPTHDLTPEQAYAFRLACAGMAMIGHGLEHAPTLPGTDDGHTRAAGVLMRFYAMQLADELAPVPMPLVSAD